jgi:hypothetical protein
MSHPLWETSRDESKSSPLLPGSFAPHFRENQKPQPGISVGIAYLCHAMKFRVNRLHFLRIIGILTNTVDLEGGKCDLLIRICASNEGVNLSCNDQEKFQIASALMSASRASV